MSCDMKGTYFHSVDNKGRLIIPTKLRDALGSEFVMSPGTDGNCIYLHSQEAWDEHMKNITSMDPEKVDVTWLRRYLRSRAMDCTIDSQGRTVIPESMRNQYKISKDVVIVGNGDRAEIWAASDWEASELETEDSFLKMQEMMKGIKVTFK